MMITRKDLEDRLSDQINYLTSYSEDPEVFTEKVTSEWIRGARPYGLFRFVMAFDSDTYPICRCLTMVKDTGEVENDIPQEDRPLFEAILHSAIPTEVEGIKPEHLPLFKEIQLKAYDHFHPEGAIEP